MVFRSPVYLVVYVVLFSLIGLVVTGSLGAAPTPAQEFQAPTRPLAVIDRDQSAVSQGLTAFLSQRGTLVSLADDTRTLQNAMAENAVPYILIIPAGYGADFLAAAASGTPAPALQSIVSVEAITGVLMDQEVNGYLNALRLTALANPGAAASVLAQQAEGVALLRAPFSLVQASDQINPANLLPFYFKWASYPMTAGVTVLIAMSFTSFQAGELRRRNLAAPLTPTAMNLQIAASSLVIMVMTWAFNCLMALLPIIGGWQLWATNPASAALIALAALVFVFVPLAIGFLFSQFGLKEAAINGLVNIVALSMMFLSGIMMGGSDYLKGPMLTVAHFIPSYWYSEAIDAVVAAPGFSLAALAPYFQSLGMVLLFALAIFSVALLVGRLRTQTATAGGNTAADVA